MSHTEVVYNYVEELDPNLTCSICQEGLVDPVTTVSCKHTFCRDCITRALAQSPSCPIDRSALTLSSLVATEPLVQLMLDELKVRCEAPGCGKVMERGVLLAHLRTCSRAVVTCGDDECGLSMARHRLPHHRAYECFHRRMDCSKCGVSVTFREVKAGGHGCINDEACGECCRDCGQTITTRAHLHRWVCPKAPIPCTQSARGCPVIVPRDELEGHLAACPFEALSAFFVANDARFAALERKHDELRAENEGLRAHVWSLRRNDILPRSLWNDTEREGQPRTESPTALDPPAEAEADAARERRVIVKHTHHTTSSSRPR